MMANIPLSRLGEFGCSEFTIKVSSYGSDGRPKQWQAITKHHNAARPWSVAVRDDPEEAAADSVSGFLQIYEGKKPERKKVAKPKSAPSLDDEAESLI